MKSNIKLAALYFVIISSAFSSFAESIIADGSDPSSWYIITQDSYVTSSTVEGESILNFSGPGISGAYYLGQHANNLTDTVVEWRMRAEQDFRFSIAVETDLGVIHLIYSPSMTEDVTPDSLLTFHLKPHNDPTNWSTFRINILTDLKKAHPDIELQAIVAFVFNGNMDLDYIKTYSFSDVDGDAIDDALETDSDIDPLADQDSDNLSNLQELIYGTDINNPDSDGDGLLDGFEQYNSLTDPNNPDSDADSQIDADEDPDADTYSNFEEQENATASHGFNDPETDYTYDFVSIFNAETDSFELWNQYEDDNYELVKYKGKLALKKLPESSVDAILYPDEYLYNKDIFEFTFLSEQMTHSDLKVEVMTNKGMRLMIYSNYIHGDFSSNTPDSYIVNVSMGMKKEDDQWFTLRANLNEDLKLASEDIELLYVKSFGTYNNLIHKISAYQYKDEDNDLIPDEIEDIADFNLHANGDHDSDGVSNLRELIENSLVEQFIDTDKDGISDYEEFNVYYTDPLSKDSIEWLNPVSVNIAQPISQIGDWDLSEQVKSVSKRGSLTYNFSTSQVGISKFVAELTQAYEQAKDKTHKIHFFINGKYIQTRKSDVTYGVVNQVDFLTPILPAGDHNVTLLYDNVLTRTALQINSLQYAQLTGDDTNENTIPDFLDYRLALTETLNLSSINSLISPAQLSGKSLDAAAVNANGVSAQQSKLGEWFANVPLSAKETNFNISLAHGIKQLSGQLNWLQTNLVNQQNLVIPLDSSLLLNAFDDLTESAIISINGQNYNVDPANPLEYLFSQEGTYSISAQITGTGANLANIQVTVIDQADIEAPYVWRNKERNWTPSAVNENVSLEAPDMTFTKINAASYTLERTEVMKDINVIARLEDRIVKVIPTKAFWLRDVVEGYVKVIETFEDGGTHVRDTMFTYNLPEDAIIQLNTFSGIVFDDGQITRSLTHEDFSETGEYTLNFFRDPTRQGAVCHRFKVIQNGEIVGEGHK